MQECYHIRVETTGKKTSSKTLIYQLPAGDSGNPYFKLLDEALDHQLGVEIIGYGGKLLIPLIFRRSGTIRPSRAAETPTKEIIHIHWETCLYGSRYVLKSLALLGLNFLSLAALKARGTRVVWTMHNTRAHDYPHPLIDAMGKAMMFRYADAILIHQGRVAAEYARRYPAKHVAWVPHGSYVGYYSEPSAAQAEALRARLGIEAGDTVILSLGMIRPYKKTEAIIRAFMQTRDAEGSRPARPDLRLVIAGSCDRAYAARLAALAAGDARISFMPGFVPDTDIAAYLRIADRSVFFYDDSELTSGGIVLSLSYGVPVLSRDIPGAEIVKRGVNGELFDDEAGLARALASLHQATPAEREAARASAARSDWDSSAKKIYDIYAGL